GRGLDPAVTGGVVGLEAPVQRRDEAVLEVAVGSTNPAKVEAVRTVFSRAFDGVQVLPVPVALPAAIGEMPVGEQVREGAIYRARAAAAAGGHFGEIGRASCRERVGVSG